MAFKEQLGQVNDRMWTVAGASLGMMVICIATLLILYIGHK